MEPLLQPLLSVLSQNAKFSFSETNCLHSVLVLNRLNTHGFITISRYMYHLAGLLLAIAFKQVFSESPHRLLNCLLTFCGSEVAT